MKMQKTIVVGAGINGVVAAIELRKRGHEVVLVDPGPLPHALAASTDISKAVRAAYGADEEYTALAEQSREIWRQWNVQFGVELYHEIGFLFLRQRSIQPGDFEYESFKLLERRGHRIERISSKQLRERYPAFNAERYPDGFLDLEAGYAESGRVVAALIQRAKSLGVELRENAKFRELDEAGDRAKGILLENGEKIAADTVVMAVGAWTPYALPFTRNFFRAGGVKIANHGCGREMSQDSPERAVTKEEENKMRQFLADSFPGLADAPIVFTRICLYCDTHDGNFWIAPDPERPELIIAAGDCGHGFKFAPVLGEIIADAVEGKSNPLLEKFRWRPEVKAGETKEAARFRGNL